MTKPPSISTGYYQRWWRFAGMIAIAVAGLMAMGSVWSGILRDTVIHLVYLFSNSPPENLTTSHLWQTCVIFWGVFLAAIAVAVYLAFVDIRYIRLQYALEKQQLLRQSLGDDLARKAMDKQHDR